MLAIANATTLDLAKAEAKAKMESGYAASAGWILQRAAQANGAPWPFETSWEDYKALTAYILSLGARNITYGMGADAFVLPEVRRRIGLD